jgi:hypothetical protein
MTLPTAGLRKNNFDRIRMTNIQFGARDDKSVNPRNVLSVRGKDVVAR